MKGMETDRTCRKADRLHTVYAVEGLTEWIALISVGKVKIRVPFTGGSMSGYGCVPATFATASKALCKLIEDSPQFKSGKIKKL